MPSVTPDKDKDLVFESPSTSVTDVATSVTDNIEFEKYKLKMNMIKWGLGTFFIALITLAINWNFKDRARGLEEMSTYEKYTTDIIVLNENPVKKRMLAQFFANATPSIWLRHCWNNYYVAVEKDFQKYLQEKKQIKEDYERLLEKKYCFQNFNKIDSIKLLRLENKLNQIASEEKAPVILPTVINNQGSLVYIQYGNEKIKDKAQEVRRLFNDNNWKAQEIDLEKGSYLNSIRYFYLEDIEVAKRANALLDNKYQIIKMNGLKSPKGQIEIWINN